MISVPASFSEGCEPLYATSGSAGLDLRAHLGKEVLIEPWSRVVVNTGVRLAIPDGYEGQVRPRSGLAFRHGITLLNAPGTIDSDYRGEIQVIMMNASDEPYAVRPGDRIAQLIIAPVVRADLVAVEFEGTARGEGGFGSTGR